MNDRTTFVALTAARWAPIGLMTPFGVLFLQSRGLSLGTIGALAMTYTVTVALLELPTGSFADAFGHRRILAIGTSLSVLRFSVLLFARSIPVFFLAAVMQGAERALRSGPLEAWYVSRTLVDDDDARRVRVGLSRPAAAAEGFALGASALLAGVLPKVLPVSTGDSGVITALSIPVAAAIVLELAHLVALFTLLPREHGTGRVTMHAPRLAIHDPQLRLLLLAPAAVGFALYSVELLWQPRLADLVGNVDEHTVLFGFLATCAFAASATGAVLVPRITRGHRVSRAALAMMVSYGAALLALAAAGRVAFFGIAFATGYVFIGVTGPLHSELLHDRVGSHVRATMLSLVSIAGMTGLLVASVTLPQIAEHVSTGAAWVVAAVVAVLGGVCYLGVREPRVTRDDGRG